MNNYAQSYGPPTSPANSRGFPPANSPGALDMYSSSQDSVGYVQAASPQPSGFPSIAVSIYHVAALHLLHQYPPGAAAVLGTLTAKWHNNNIG